MNETGRDLWRWRVEQTPERVFLSFEGREWTIAPSTRTCGGSPRAWRARGVEAGAAVLVSLANRPEALQVQLALQELGAVFVPLLAGLTAAELAYPINHSEAALLIAEPEVADQVAGLDCPRLRRVIGVDELPMGDPRPPAPLAGYDEDSLAAILYTSGSTGRPKGVMLRAGSVRRRRGVRRPFRRQRAGHVLPADAAGPRRRRADRAVDGAAARRAAGVVDRFSPSSFWRQVAEAGAPTASSSPPS